MFKKLLKKFGYIEETEYIYQIQLEQMRVNELRKDIHLYKHKEYREKVKNI